MKIEQDGHRIAGDGASGWTANSPAPDVLRIGMTAADIPHPSASQSGL
jgi:hypothetical protein